MTRCSLKIVDGPTQLAQVAAEMFTNAARDVLHHRPHMSVVLSGGSTPKHLYETLSKLSDFPWEKIHFFWGDERYVPIENADSNFKMAREALLMHVPVPPENIHRVKTDLPTAREAAEDYEQELIKFFKLNEPTRRPRFDLVFLGLGEDGHTLSVFPDGHPGPRVSQIEPSKLVFAPWVAHLESFRISLTPQALSQADRVIFLVSGNKKADILQRVLEHAEELPAQLIQPSGKLTWLIDRPAAQKLLSH